MCDHDEAPKAKLPSPNPLSPDTLRVLSYSWNDEEGALSIRIEWDEVLATILGIAQGDVEDTEAWWAGRIHPGETWEVKTRLREREGSLGPRHGMTSADDRERVLDSLHAHLERRDAVIFESRSRLWNSRYRQASVPLPFEGFGH